MIGSILALLYMVVSWLFGGATPISTASETLGFLWRWNLLAAALYAVIVIGLTILMAIGAVRSKYYRFPLLAYIGWFLWFGCGHALHWVIQFTLTLGGIKLMQIDMMTGNVTQNGLLGAVAYVCGIIWQLYCLYKVRKQNY